MGPGSLAFLHCLSSTAIITIKHCFSECGPDTLNNPKSSPDNTLNSWNRKDSISCTKTFTFQTVCRLLLSDGASMNGHRVVDNDVMHYVTATKADTSVAQCNVSNRNGYVYANIALTVIGQFPSFYTTVLRDVAIIGSRPSDHYFVVSVCLSVCLFVCLFVCAEFFSAVFDPISIKQGHMLYVWV